MSRCQSLSSTVCSGRRSPVPALLTRMSIRPSVCATASTTSVDLVAVAHVERVRVTADLGRDRQPRRRRRGRSTATVAPSAANRRAVAAPMPDAPPVMTATRPSSSATAPNLRRLGRGARPLSRPRHRAAGERRHELGVVGAVDARPGPRSPRARRRTSSRCSSGTAITVRPSRAPWRTGSRRAQRFVRGGRVEPDRGRRRESHTAASGISPDGPTSRTAAQSAGTTSARSAARRPAPCSTAVAQVEQLAIGAQRARAQQAVGDGEVDRALVAVQRGEPCEMTFLLHRVHAERDARARRARRGAR